MFRVSRLLLLAAIAALLVASGTAASAQPPGAASASAAKKGKKKCPKGKVLKTVTVKRNGKKVKVKRCRKARKAAPKPGPGPGAQGLFEPPGRRLEGNDAVPFLQRYLANSTFTDCPAGWPNCAVEERYSHFSDGSFYYCRLTPTSGSDIRSSQTYQVQNAVVEADGSWTFNEAVSGGGFYEWRVATNGQVVGAYSFEGGPVEQLGPFQYVSGGRDCSY